MSLETDAMFAEDKQEFDAEAEQARLKAEAERVKLEREFLLKNKCFKDLILGREDIWEACKDNIALYAFRLPEVGNDVVTKDVLAGMRFCLEYIDGRRTGWDDIFKKLGGN